MSTNNRSVRTSGSATAAKRVTKQPSSQGSYDEIVDYFWVKLYGQVIPTWNDLPEELKAQIFPKVGINSLSDQHVQELFNIRGNNDKTSFVDKLKYFKV